jgi:hypothetical protein
VTVGCALALPVVLALTVGARADVELGVRSEGRTSVLAPADLPTETRTAVTAEPHARTVIDASWLRLRTGYSARLWTSDVEAQRSPLVNHTLDARVETRHDRAWRAEATGSATRGSTDPLAELSRTTAVPAQLPATAPLRYEELRTGARGDVALDLRTTIAAGGAWFASRGADDEARALLPSQRSVALDASVAHRVTERDTLRVAATAGRTLTSAPEGTRTGTVSTAAATWRRRLTPRLDGWVGAGAALTREDEPAAPGEPPAPPRTDLLPVAEAGLARGGEDVRVTVELAARIAPFVDRFTGEVRTMADARCGLRWQATERLSVSGSASGGARTDGQTVLAAADLRFGWAVRPRLGLEAGVLARRQRERRPDVPSFFEGGVVVAVTYDTGPLFRPDLR